jgi:hypothetical protein
MRLLNELLMRLAILSSLFAVGCATTPEGPGTDPVGTPEDPVPAKTGPYTVTSTVDFTPEVILPPQVELVVVTLREFSTNPARALIEVANQAGVPAVKLLYDAIPGVIKDRIEDFINGEIAKLKLGDKPITEYAGEIAALAEIALTQFALESELDLQASPATHRLTALDLSPTGLVDIRIPIGGLAGDVLTQRPTLSVAEGGQLALGEQHFGLNYGEYAWQGIEAASTALFGGGVRDTLGKAVNCPALAQNVASKCVLNVCVGHETELRAICEGGLDAIVGFSHARMAEQRIEAFRLASGAARLVDDDGDGVGDRIVDGVWDAKLNVGLGLRPVPATFLGAR